jgi:hypothetical protein
MKMEKIRPVEAFPRRGGWGIKKNDGRGEFKYDMLQEIL